VALTLHLTWPALGNWPFIIATLVGLVPIAQGAWRALRVGQPFTIEMLMTIAAGGRCSLMPRPSPRSWSSCLPWVNYLKGWRLPVHAAVSRRSPI